MLGVKMAEAPLQLQVLRHRAHACGTEAVIEGALLWIPLPHGIEATFDDQTAEINRARCLVDEALLAGRVDHEVPGAFVIESLANFVHQVDGITHACRRHIAMRVASGHHAREIFGE